MDEKKDAVADDESDLNLPNSVSLIREVEECDGCGKRTLIYSENEYLTLCKECAID